MKKSYKLSALAGALLITLSSCSTTSSVLVSGAFDIIGEVAEQKNMSNAVAVVQAAKVSTENAMEEITPENEYYIGRAVAATVLTNYKVLNNQAKQSYLNKICRVITENSDQPELFNGYHVKILDSSEVNAFATSGGHIFVTTGMIECASSEDELAAVIAHEVSHIQLKHSLNAIKASRWTGVVTSTAGAAARTEMAAIMHEIVSSVCTNLVNSGYSQKQEFAADEKALTLLADAGYNPSALTALLKTMAAKQKGKTGGFYKTHPLPEVRIANVKTAIVKVSSPKNTASARTARFAAIMN